MARPDLGSLELFVAAVDCGSISQAATVQGISQPTASVHLSNLERSVGVQLLHRTPAGTVPTEAGTRLLASAVRVLQAARELEETASLLRSSVADERLQVATNSVIGEYLLPRWIRILSSGSSDIAISVRNSTDTIAQVIGRKVELGFAAYNGEQLETPLERVVIGHDELVLAAPPRWAREHGVREMSPSELARERLIVRGERPGMLSVRDHIDRLLAPYRPDPPPLPLLELGSTSAVKAAVLDGAGPEVISRLAIDDDLAHGRLVEIPVPGLDLRRTLCALWRRDTMLRATASRLVEIAADDQEVPTTPP